MCLSVRLVRLTRCRQESAQTDQELPQPLPQADSVNAIIVGPSSLIHVRTDYVSFIMSASQEALISWAVFQVDSFFWSSVGTPNMP